MRAFYLSLIPFFLTNNLLLLNQCPDIAADQSTGRKTFPIVYGIRNSSIVYGVFVTLSCVVLGIGLWLEWLPTLSNLCFIPLAVALPTLICSAKFAKQPLKLTPFLALNIVVALLTPLLLGLSIIIG